MPLGLRIAVPRRLTMLASLCGGLLVLVALLGAGRALAARQFDSEISESFPGLASLSIDARGNVWITDEGHPTPANNPGQNGVYEHNPYPSQTLLKTLNTSGPVGTLIVELQAAVDAENGEIFVANSNPRKVDIYEESGHYAHSWTSINSALSCFTCNSEIHVGIDNTETDSGGRIYLSLTYPEDDVEAFDAEENPVDFPATASYINDNKLMGTPAGPFGQVGEITVDDNGNIYVTDVGHGTVDEFNSTGTFVRKFGSAGTVAVDPLDGNILIGGSEFDASGNFLESLPTSQPLAVNAQGYLYAKQGPSGITIYKPNTVLATVVYQQPASAPSSTGGTLKAQVSPNGGGEITACEFEYGEAAGQYTLGALPCEATGGLPYGGPTEVSATLTGLSAETTYHYRVALSTSGGTKYGLDQAFTPHAVVGLSTEAPDGLTESGATLHGSVLGDGTPTTYHFQWGRTLTYGHATPSTALGSPAGPGSTALSAALTGLRPYSTYHYRVVAENGAHEVSLGEDRSFTTSAGVPTAANPAVADVHSDRAVLEAEIDPNGADTTAHFEYVTTTQYLASGWANARTASETPREGRGKLYRPVSALVDGLEANTFYRYRITGTNALGGGSTEATFKTFGFAPSFSDPCPNAHARQQTGASLLLDCRGYELVSAADAGGYDVESDLVPGQMPFAGYPEAKGPEGEPRVLYGVHDGGIPGAGKPTNHGVDPYVATRGAEGWTTRYVGIPSDNPYSAVPFASTVLGADADLESFVFGGSDICSPCFPSSTTETGEPVHLPNGELAQGMAGSINQPAAVAAGFVATSISANGEHLIFGSKSQFEPDGNNGEISIYDRNLRTGETRVVSKAPNGSTMTGAGIGEVALSADGSHVLIGQLVSEEGGAKHWHLYMNVGDSSQTIDLTPGAAQGVVFDGMTADGSKVYFASEEHLTGEDTQHSGDSLFMWEEGQPLNLVSKGDNPGNPGEPGNAASCNPVANTAELHWNTTGAAANCGVVAVAGGVASGDGTVYFLSPEALDTSSPKHQPVPDAPNLYVVRPGSAPQFIATLESSANAPIPPPAHPFLRSFGIFEKPAGVAIDHATGDFYVLDITGREGTGSVQKFNSSGHPITTFANHGVLEVPGMEGNEGLPCQIGIDELTGDFYVPAYQNNLVGEFDSAGNHVATLEVTRPSAVAVDQANGDAYVSSYGESDVQVFDSSGNTVTEFSTLTRPTGVAVDSSGTAFVVTGGGGSGAKGVTEIYGPTGKDVGKLDKNPSYGVAVDPADDHVYVDEGDQITEYNTARKPAGPPIGQGLLASSISLAVDSGTVAVSNPGSADVAVFGPGTVPSTPSVDSPVVLNSVSSPGRAASADFEVTPSGDFAAFPSALPLTGYDNASHREVFRYDATVGRLQCASCNLTSERATGEAGLPNQGLGLTDDGRVFFNSTEGLVDRDLNSKEDAYQWEAPGFEYGHGTAACEGAKGCVQLISTGASPAASSLLGVSSDGTDAYFFTREKLAEEDLNGGTIKLYDARELGGFAFAPAEIQCKASDECHGAGSQAQPPPLISTNTSAPVGNEDGRSSGRCKPGFAKRKGKCVKKPHRKRHRRGGRGSRG